MKTLTLAEAFVTINPAPARTPRWTGIDVVYMHLKLFIGRRGLVLTASILDGSQTWTASGWRAWPMFERLAGARTTIPVAKYLEPAGLRKVA
jgi:hypothetical protein